MKTDLTQSYDKSPYTNTKNSNVTTQKNLIKTSITQRVWADLGRSFGVTTVPNWCD